MTSWLVRSTPDRAVRVQAVAGDIALCSWARLDSCSASLNPGVYILWVPANLLLGVALR